MFPIESDVRLMPRVSLLPHRSVPDPRVVNGSVSTATTLAADLLQLIAAEEHNFVARRVVGHDPGLASRWAGGRMQSDPVFAVPGPGRGIWRVVPGDPAEDHHHATRLVVGRGRKSLGGRGD